MRKLVFIAVILILTACFQANAQTCSTAPNGLVSWYKAEGNALDRNSRFNGTLQNGATYAGGKVGQAFSFDGNDDKVFVPHNASLNVANVTAEAWVYPTAFGGQGSIINKRTAINNAGYGLEPTAGGNLSFFLYIGGNTFFTVSTGTLPLNTWTHVAGTFDGSTLKVFINGVQDGSTSASGSIDATTGDLVIGENIVNGTNWAGLIDEPTVYNRALSASELLAIVTAGTAGKCISPTASSVGLVSWWSAENNTLDLRSRNNGTIQGNVTYSAGIVGQTFQLGGTGDLSGNGDRVIVGNPANLQLQDFTIETWIKRSSAAIVTNSPFPGVAGGTFFAYGQNGYGFLIDQNTNRLALTNVGNSNVFSNLTVTDTNWHHVAVTKQGTQTVFYVDGVADTQSYSTLFSFTTNAAIGARGDSNVQNAFFGAVNELSIYNRPLSANEIQDIVNADSLGKAKPTATTAPNNLVGWWNGDGNSNDSAGTNNGTLQNGAGYAFGKVGQAFSFDGVDDGEDLGNWFTYTNFTLEMWVNPGATQIAFANIVDNNHTLTQNWVLQQDDTSTNVYNFTGTSNFTLSPNVWQHLVVTHDNSNAVNVYVNGTVVATGTLAINYNGTQFLRLGRWGNSLGQPSDRNWNGKIDEFSVYDRTLTVDEIQSIFNAGIAGKLKDNTTPTGANIVVNTKSDATVTFPTVSTAGITQQIPLDLSLFPSLPSGSTSTGLNYDIATSAVYSGNPLICFNVPSVTNPTAFNNLRIMHLENNVWINRTALGSINFATRTICTNSGLPSLSPFAIVNGFAPTAATASISGRVKTATGRGITNAVIQLTNSSTGETKYHRTTTFGYFNFSNLTVGETYIVSISSKRYTFKNPSQVVSLSEDLTGFDFTALP